MAIAVLGGAGGTEAFGTVIYTSPDGHAWTEVTATPGRQAGAQFDLVRSGDRLVAVGQAETWISDDEGASWTVGPDAAALGTLTAAATTPTGWLVAAGFSGPAFGPPAFGPNEPIAWRSDDDGETWQSVALDGGGNAVPQDVAVGPDGSLVMLGYAVNDAGDQVVVAWRSTDDGASWQRIDVADCCPGQLAATPTGYVATTFSPAVGQLPADLISADGTSWSPAGTLPASEVRSLAFLDGYGLTGVGVSEGGDSWVLLTGPHPYP